MREQFTFYRSYFDAIRRLKKAADRAAIYDAIADYALYGNATELSDAAGAIFDLIRPTLDAAKRKSDGAKSKTSGKDTGESPEKDMQDTDKIPARCAQGEIEDARNEKEKEKEKEYEKESYIKETLSIESVKKSAPRFTPPTMEEVAAYCSERGNSVDAERFCSFYQSNGWKVGKNPMKDWKAAVRTWEKRDAHSKNEDAFSAALRRELNHDAR